MSYKRIPALPRDQTANKMFFLLTTLAVFGYLFSDSTWWENPSKSTENYDVSIHVQANGSLDIEERFDLDVGKYAYSFGRNIPAKIELDAKIYPVAVSDVHITMDHDVKDFRISSNEDMHSLGVLNHSTEEDPRRNTGNGINGKHQFVFQYHIDHGLIKQEDGALKLYWPVNGIWYRASIAHSSVEITFPKFVKYDPNSFADDPFSESEQSRPVSTWKNSNTYHANIQSLKGGEQWGVNIDLPATGFNLPKITSIGVIEPEVEPLTWSGAIKRLFTNPKGEAFHGWKDIPRATLALMPWILLLVCMWRLYPIWLEVRAKSEVTACTSYTPPESLAAAEAGLLIDQDVSSSDIGAAILELELDGFLTIDGYILRSVKDADRSTLPDYKSYLLKALFRNRDAVSFELTLEKSYREDLDKWERDLSYDLKKVKDKLTLLMENKGYIIADSVQKRTQFGRAWGWLAIGSFFVAFAQMFYIAREMNLMMIIGFSLVPSFFLLLFSTLVLNAAPGQFIVKGLNAFLFLCLFLLELIFLQMMIPNMAGIPGALQAGLLPSILLGILTRVIKKSFSDKSAKGRKVLNEILGYRNFLWSVEVDRLSKDVKNHPEAYPYAVAFGLMDDWVIYIQSQCAIRVSRNDHN